MSLTQYHHGVRVIEKNSTGAAIRVVSTAVIAMPLAAPASASAVKSTSAATMRSGSNTAIRTMARPCAVSTLSQA